MISRRWKQRKNVQNVSLLIIDETHLIGGEVAPFLQVIKDGALLRTVAYGIGFLHDGLSSEEQRAVSDLHSSGAIQVLVVTHSMCWALSLQSHLCVLMDTQFYDGAEHRYTDIPHTLHIL